MLTVYHDLKRTVMWDVTPCSLGEVHQCLRGACSLHLKHNRATIKKQTVLLGTTSYRIVLFIVTILRTPNPFSGYKSVESNSVNTKCMFLHVSALLLKHIDLARLISLCSVDGYMLLGCSNLTGRFWTGSLWYFLDPDSAPDVEKCLTGIECETGITDGKFLEDNNKVIIGEDSGVVQVLGLSESPGEHTFHFESLSSVCEHDDSVLSVSVFSDGKRAVTGGLDMNIKVWSVESLTSECTYRPAHLHQVSSVCTHPQDGSSVFASCSLDGMALIWDTRNAKPARVALNDGSQGLTSVAWHMSQSDLLAVGSNSGDIIMIDVRQLKEPLGLSCCFIRPIHRLRFAHHWPELLAVCADDSRLKVLDCTASSPTVIYEDDRHDDFVRGLAWHPRSESLFSCGWDKQVLAHKFALSRNKMEVNGIIEKDVDQEQN